MSIYVEAHPKIRWTRAQGDARGSFVQMSTVQDIHAIYSTTTTGGAQLPSQPLSISTHGHVLSEPHFGSVTVLPSGK
jgi:hypothetical protein